MDSEKKYTYQDGLLLATWTQIHNQNLAAIADPGLSCTMHLWEAQQVRLPRLLAIGANPCKEVSGIIFLLRYALFIWNCVLHPPLHLYQPIKESISITTKWMHDSNQLGQC